MTQRFDAAVALFRDAGGAAGQGGAGRGFGVDRVALALVAAYGTVGPVDLDHADVFVCR